MKISISVQIVLIFSLLACKQTSKNVMETKLSVSRLDQRINQLIPEGELPEIIAEGFEWAEGPLWIPSKQMLLFSDIPQNSVFMWTQESGAKLYLKSSGYTGSDPRQGESGSNGLLLDHSGRLILCQHGDRRLGRMLASVETPEPVYETLVDNFRGSRLNSPNDATISRKGDIYFTDPPYGLEKNMDDPAKEIEYQGVYRLSAEGKLSLLTREMSRPNGIALSPDESRLYVANSDPERAVWMQFDLSPEGELKNPVVFFDATPLVKTEKGLPDGLKVDDKGNLFAAGPGGVLIFTPDGEHLGTIKTGQATANCAFNEDYSVLYMTADMYLMRIRLK